MPSYIYQACIDCGKVRLIQKRYGINETLRSGHEKLQECRKALANLITTNIHSSIFVYPKTLTQPLIAIRDIVHQKYNEFKSSKEM